MSDSFFVVGLSESRLKLGDIKKSGDHLLAQNMAIEDIDPVFFRTESDEEIEKTSKILSALIKQLKITKKDAKIVIPDSFSYNQFIEVPKLNEKELLSAIKYQADQFIPMPLEEVNLDIEIIYEDPSNKKMLTLLAASPKKIVEKVEKFLEYSGLVPDSVETETSATGRFLSEFLRGGEESKGLETKGGLIINMDLSSSSIYFFDYKLNLMTYCYNFPIGYNLFFKEVQVNLNVDEKKSRELLKSIGLSENASYDLKAILAPVIKSFTLETEKAVKELIQKSNIQIKNIYLINESIGIDALDELIGKYFGIPTSYLNLYSYFTKNNVVDFFQDKLGYFVSVVGGNLA